VNKRFIYIYFVCCLIRRLCRGWCPYHNVSLQGRGFVVHAVSRYVCGWATHLPNRE